jgi:hypothetical protein
MQSNRHDCGFRCLAFIIRPHSSKPCPLPVIDFERIIGEIPLEKSHPYNARMRFVGKLRLRISAELV